MARQRERLIGVTNRDELVNIMNGRQSQRT